MLGDESRALKCTASGSSVTSMWMLKIISSDDQRATRKHHGARSRNALSNIIVSNGKLSVICDWIKMPESEEPMQ